MKEYEVKRMRFTEKEKKQLLIYVLIAFGIPYLLGLLMWYGSTKGVDLSVFANAQMMYPAAGVMLAYMITKKEDLRIPKRFFVMVVIFTALMAVMSIVSVFAPSENMWILAAQLMIMAGSVLGWILLLTEKKEKREAYGLRFRKWKSSVFCVVLFVFLYLLRTVIAYALEGQLSAIKEITGNPMTWITLAALPVNFFLVFLAFFGEEYGWRYFLQPLLQKRFGLRWGVIVVGVVWGLWHLPINFFYYSLGSGLASAAGQQITCITLGIFMAYAYMKTKNIWVPVILHYLNNNLIPVITANYSADVLQNQQAGWSELLPALIMNGLIFGGFLFTKYFRRADEIPEVK